MHLFFMVRGVMHQIHLFELFMQTQMFPWKRTSLTMCECGHKKEDHVEGFECKEFKGREEMKLVQGALRKFPLGYEYVFPEECLDEVLTMLEITPDSGIGWGMNKTERFFLRKLCKAKPIKSYRKIPTNRFIPMMGIALYPIGIKKDRRHKWEEVGYDQEML